MCFPYQCLFVEARKFFIFDFVFFCPFHFYHHEVVYPLTKRSVGCPGVVDVPTLRRRDRGERVEDPRLVHPNVVL